MPSVSQKQHRFDFPSSEEIAWAAGVFCGEGTLSIHRPRRHIGIRLTVGQSATDDQCPDMLTKLQAIFGGKIYRMGWKKHAHHRTIWQFYIHNFEHVQAVIAMMWYWLTADKKRQAEHCLNLYHFERKLKGLD